MLPLIPFVAGLVVGVAAIKLYKNEKIRPELDKAEQKLRESTAVAQEKLHETSVATRQRLRKATVSGLNSIETTSAHLREKLGPEEDKPAKGKAKP